MNRSVNLIMPVFRGGNLWEPALVSVVQARDLFDVLVVSFDGPTRSDLADQLSAKKYSANFDHLLVTPTEMSAVEHLNWILNQEPVASWGDRQLITLVAEDDLVEVTALRRGLEAVKENEHSILFGSWCENGPSSNSLITDTDHVNTVQIFSEKEIATQLSRWVRNNEVTTVSGMTFELGVLRSYVRQVYSNGDFLLSGIRAEYFLATQPTVKTLIRCSLPITRIQTHEQQEGRIVKRDIKIRDETLYQLWLLLTRQKMRSTERFMASLRLIKGLAKKPSTFYLLPSAFKALRTSNYVA